MNGLGSPEKEVVTLKGVPETLLWPLFNRAHEARRKDGLLKDEMAVQTAERIDYAFEKSFGKHDEGAPLRALAFDQELRRFLDEHPFGTVVSLGDGLETQFWRLDNGKLKWLSVDLPDTIALRARVLPQNERLRNVACSALDPKWMDGVDSTKGVFVSAQGLLMYFKPNEVAELVGRCAARFSGGTMMFDIAPRWISQKTQSKQGWKTSKTYRVPAMPWGLNPNELQTIKAFHSGIKSVREVPLPRGRGFLFRYIVPLIRYIPFLRNQRPMMALVAFAEARENEPL